MNLTQEERLALTFIAHNDPRDGFVRRTWLEFKTAICGLLQRTRSNGWISVDERLPTEDENVLVSTTDGIHVASVDEYGLWWPSAGDACGFPDVSHWMPLPEPPKAT